MVLDFPKELIEENNPFSRDYIDCEGYLIYRRLTDSLTKSATISIDDINKVSIKSLSAQSLIDMFSMEDF